MAFAHFVCFTCLARVAAVVSPDQRQVMQVHASGWVRPSVVRRVERADNKEMSHATTFSGLLRTDRYAFNHGMNCSSGHGGDEIGSTLGQKLADCQNSCAHDDECTCVNFEPSSGKCGKQRYCHLEDCVPSALVDTYTQHSTFKLPRAKSLSESVPQAAFERSGGRVCSNATELDTASSAVEDLSVTQCLQRCQQNAACTCVRYERFYQSECFLMSGCAQPNFCTRTNRYDTYALMATPAPTNAPTTLAPTTSAPTNAPTQAPTTLAPTTSAPTDAPTQESSAGEYEVWYRGGRRGTNMIIRCDNSATQPGIFTDRLHFDNVRTKCSQSRDAAASLYIERTHGTSKYECLHKSGTTILGSHYTGPNAFWGTIEYRLITANSCLPTPPPTPVPAGSSAGEYAVYYKGGRRGTNLIIRCDNSATQPGIFTDRLHFDNVRTKCSQSRDAAASLYIERTHGTSKYECLHKSGTTILGSHYTGPNAFWGTIEYRLITRTACR